MNENQNPPNPLEPSKISKSISSLANGDFDLVSLSRNTETADKLVAKSDFIAILPFDRTDDGKIANLYAIKFQNHATDKADVTVLVDRLDSEKDQTAFDSIGRAMLEEAGVNIDELGINEDDIFYIGPMSFSEPIIANFKCYAIDLTKINRPDQPIEFARTLAKSPFNKDESEIIKIGFHQVVNGDFTDVTILACSFLLVSYFQ